MITHEELERLLEWKASQPYLVTSVYLNTDRRAYTGDEYVRVLRDLLEDKRKELATLDVPKDQQRSVLEDFSKIEERVQHHFRNDEKPGFVAFSCGAAGLWQSYPLPRPVSNTVIVDPAPYARPLLVLADEFERLCAVVVDRRRGHVFEIFMGEIREIADIVDDVPGKSRGTGHQMKAETAITRRIGEQWRVHYKNVADVTLRLFKRRSFDRLLVGGPAADLPDFEKTLHSYLQQRIAGRLSVQVGLESTPLEVLRQARDIEAALGRERGVKLVDSLLTQAHSGKLGVVGLADTLKALRYGQVHTLVLENGLRAPGVVCSSCRFIGLGEQLCPQCQKAVAPTKDAVEAAIAEAAQQGCEVRHVAATRELEAVGSIGALLRYRI